MRLGLNIDCIDVDTDRPDTRADDFLPPRSSIAVVGGSQGFDDPAWWQTMVDQGLIAGDPVYYSGGYAPRKEYINAVMHLLHQGVITRSTALAHVPGYDFAPNTTP